MLLLEVAKAIVRSRKCLSTGREMASEGAPKVNRVEVSFEIFV
jgi:hypothetical protein